MIAVPITKRMEIIMNIQDCLISQININYEENGGKKKLWPQIQSSNIMYPNVVIIILVPIIKRNGDYYEYARLSYFMDKH